jgi:hypothetical protein
VEDPDPKRIFTELLPVARIAIGGVRGDVSSRNRHRGTGENGVSEVEGLVPE